MPPMRRYSTPQSLKGLQNLVDIHGAVFGGMSRLGVHTSFMNLIQRSHNLLQRKWAVGSRIWAEFWPRWRPPLTPRW